MRKLKSSACRKSPLSAFKHGVGFLMLILLAACASLDTRSPEERVEERAVAQAQALLDQDYEAALEFVTPSYRNGPKAELYEAKFSGAVFWIRVEPRWVRCDEVPEPERCSVRMWIFNDIPWSNRGNSIRGGDVPISWDTTWIKLDGEWYQYL